MMQTVITSEGYLFININVVKYLYTFIIFYSNHSTSDKGKNTLKMLKEIQASCLEGQNTNVNVET